MTTGSMRLRRAASGRGFAAVVVLLSTLLASLLPASPAAAVDPVDLGDGYVADESDVLTPAQEDAAEERLQRLADESDVDLYVVFVDEFTNPSDRVGWADATAERNSLGPDQYLLAVAVDQRAYYISADSGGPRSDGELDRIEQGIRPLLAESDWGGAVDRAAADLQGDGGTGWLWLIGVVVAIGLIALVVWLIVRARRTAAKRRRGAMPEAPDPADPFSTITDADLETRAGSALVQADDAIASSREELGFAVAEFGEASTAAFSATVDTAQQKLSQAFAIKQRLDDEVADTVQQRRAWHIEIITLCEQAEDLLDDNAEAFDELRRLAADAPPAIERVSAQRAELASALPGAAPALAALAGAYDAEALRTVADNPAQAAARVALADRSIEAARAAVAADRSGEAAFAIRTAEQAIAQGAQLVAAVIGLGNDLAAVEKQARDLIAEMQADLAAAAQLPDADGTLAATVASTSTQLEQATAALAGTSRNPQRLLDLLTAANTQIDGAIAGVREKIERTERARGMLRQQILQAQAQIRSAAEYIATRRGSVGPVARTRLADAEAALSQAIALQESDPEQALTLAVRALTSSRAAIDLAQQDTVRSQPQLSDGVFGDLFGSSPSSSGGGSGIAGDVLGGIIGGLLAGGGSGRGSGGWRSSGGFRTSGFGGGGRSSFRSSGGGRGRSGGGRF